MAKIIRNIPRWLILSPVLAAALVSTNGLRAAPTAPPNVLFIAIDDLRNALACSGDPIAKTPNIDGLARQGMLFDRAYCQEAVCNPSRQSLLSGRRPDAIKVWNMTSHFRKTTPGTVSLPEYFKQHGYFTESIGKIYHGAVNMGDPQSWSVPELFAVTSTGIYARPENQPPAGKIWAKSAATEMMEIDDDAYVDGMVATEAIKALQAHKEGPFFLAVGFRKPHLPFTAPKKYWDLYDRQAIPLPEPSATPRDAPIIALENGDELPGYTGIPETRPLPEASVRELRHGYYAAMSYSDAQVGRVLAELDRLGLRDNTIIVLWGDNGYHLGDLGGLWCKDTAYEEAARIPLIFSAPQQVKKNTRTNSLVELVDLYPTLAELCHLPKPANVDGVSLVPVLNDPKAEVKQIALSQFPRPWPYKGKLPESMGYALRTKQFRYVEWANFATQEVFARELYDLDKEIVERVNVAADPAYAKVVEDLSRQLHEARKPR